MHLPESKLFQTSVVNHYMISSSSGIIRFKRQFSFKAGQVINITNRLTLPPRMYSIASGENDEYVDILYKEITSGELTPSFRQLETGDKLYISQPFGKFLGTQKKAYFIATGTGIAPFLSMLQSGITENKTLIHGSRTLEDFYYQSQLQELLKDNYIRCYTGTEKHQYFGGRVTNYIEQLQKPDPNIMYYLCGSAEMVVETRQALIMKGIPFQQIKSEIYF